MLDALSEVAQREGVASMVVGLAVERRRLAGAPGAGGRGTSRGSPRAWSGVPVEMWDERLSTREAEAIVRAQGRSTRRVRERGELDAVAAAVILQDYLDHRATPTR